jgi:hypothetical protein
MGGCTKFARNLPRRQPDYANPPKVREVTHGKGDGKPASERRFIAKSIHHVCSVELWHRARDEPAIGKDKNLWNVCVFRIGDPTNYRETVLHDRCRYAVDGSTHGASAQQDPLPRNALQVFARAR